MLYLCYILHITVITYKGVGRYSVSRPSCRCVWFFFWERGIVMKKQFAAIFAATAVLGVTAAFAANPFSDVTPDSWFPKEKW